MNLPEFSSNNTQIQWERFCKLLWFNDDLGMWIDISRMKINSNDIEDISPLFNKAINSMNELEKGSIANKQENRLVGHYWLRNPGLAPNENISLNIKNEISSIRDFGNNILSGKISTDKNEKFTDVLWIGIGGSGLGPLLIVEAIQKYGNGLNFHFIDNIDPVGIEDTLKRINKNIVSTLFVVVSKSGNTLEPQIAMDQSRKYLEQSGGNWSKHAVSITMKNSKLDLLSQDENWLHSFDMPDWVGGRTSITGAVGLIPISLINEDISDFINGASLMDHLTRNTDLTNNPAALLALSWMIAGKGKGLRDMVILPYNDRLQVFSRYLQQLVMESLGKKEDRQGRIVNQGIAVYGNKGSTDQHAYVQQLRDGIDNFFVTFIEVIRDSESINSINDKHPGDYLSGFLQGTRNALTEGDRQSLLISINEFNLKTLGALVALFERAVGFYSEFVDINAYNQPGVEAGKIAAADVISLQLKIIDLLNDGIKRSINDINQHLPGSSKETIYLILRHISKNNNKYFVSGDWKKPNSLAFLYKK